MSWRGDTQPHRFAVLDGMCALAACAVIADHVASPTIVGQLTPRSYLAADFFFVLSGFVLAHAWGRLTKSGNILPFLKARLIRFYPHYLAALSLSALIIYAEMGWSQIAPSTIVAAFTFNLFFLPCPPLLSPNGSNLFPFDGPAYSLFFELVANAAFAFLASRLFGLRLAALLAAAAIFLAWTALCLGQLGRAWAWPHFSAWLARVSYSFVGVAVYKFWAWRKLPGLPHFLAFAILALVLAIPAEGIWRPAYDCIAALIIFQALVAFSARSSSSAVAHLFLDIAMRRWLSRNVAFAPNTGAQST